MEVRAPKGQYRVIGLDPVDTLTWPSGPLWKDCETFDEALDLAARNDELYLRCPTTRRSRVSSRPQLDCCLCRRFRFPWLPPKLKQSLPSAR
jgi:hypothetical protein